MVSEAQKRAAAKYQRESTKRKALTFYKSEVDILEWLESQENQAGYIKRLIREDMERHAAS